MMLKYEQFATIIGHMKEQLDKERKLMCEMYETLIDGHAICKISQILMQDIISLLEFNFMDKFKTIDWWVWECDFGEKNTIIFDNNMHKQHNLNSMENLYNYLVENYKSNLFAELKSYTEKNDVKDILEDPSILFQKVNNIL